MAFASERRPPCKYEVLPGVAGVMFDNYSRKVLYSSKATVESHGFLLNMTNWGTIQVPRLVAPLNFDVNEACASSSELACPCDRRELGPPPVRRETAFCQHHLDGGVHLEV